MKKTLLVFMAFLLSLLPLFSASASEVFDLDYIRASEYVQNELIRVEEREYGYYVYNNFAIHDLAIAFDQESDEYYSFADFDIAVFEENGAALPLLRLWFTLWTEGQRYDVTSLTVVGYQNEYVFSNLYDDNFFDEDRGDYSQNLLILFDSASMQCLNELMSLRELMKISEDWADRKLKVVFHGSEDLITELDDHFWSIFDVYLDLYLNSNGPLCLQDYKGTVMEVNSLQQ